MRRPTQPQQVGNQRAEQQEALPVLFCGRFHIRRVEVGESERFWILCGGEPDYSTVEIIFVLMTILLFFLT